MVFFPSPIEIIHFHAQPQPLTPVPGAPTTLSAPQCSPAPSPRIGTSEPPLEWHMPIFTSKCFPSSSIKIIKSCRYHVLAETGHFVRLAGECTLYPGSRSMWKLQLNKITSGVDQQAKPSHQTPYAPYARKLIRARDLYKLSLPDHTLPSAPAAVYTLHMARKRIGLNQPTK